MLNTEQHGSRQRDRAIFGMHFNGVLIQEKLDIQETGVLTMTRFFVFAQTRYTDDKPWFSDILQNIVFQ